MQVQNTLTATPNQKAITITITFDGADDFKLFKKLFRHSVTVSHAVHDKMVDDDKDPIDQPALKALMSQVYQAVKSL